MEEMKISGSNEASTWKVYDNPFYWSHHLQQLWLSSKHLHHQIVDLQGELENQLKARRKAESLNQKLAKELAEQRRGREALERVCDKLALRISMDKSEINKMKSAFQEERKMLRMAEVLSEKRVQTKMAAAKILFEANLLELEETKRAPPPPGLTMSSATAVHRKASPETENPHIKRGIKGFVEFPRGVRAMNGSRSRHCGSKLECRKAQLSVLLKQKTPSDRIASS